MYELSLPARATRCCVPFSVGRPAVRLIRLTATVEPAWELRNRGAGRPTAASDQWPGSPPPGPGGELAQMLTDGPRPGLLACRRLRELRRVRYPGASALSRQNGPAERARPAVAQSASPLGSDSPDGPNSPIQYWSTRSARALRPLSQPTSTEAVGPSGTCTSGLSRPGVARRARRISLPGHIGQLPGRDSHPLDRCCYGLHVALPPNSDSSKRRGERPGQRAASSVGRREGSALDLCRSLRGRALGSFWLLG
jgi:hypothetical protein